MYLPYGVEEDRRKDYKARATKEVDKWTTRNCDEITAKAKKLLQAIELIPEGIPFYFEYGEIVLGTASKRIFTKLAKKANSKAEKYINSYSKTGELQVKVDGVFIRSKPVKLPATCTFKKVTKTYEVLEPEGNCGPWFKDGDTAKEAA